MCVQTRWASSDRSALGMNQKLATNVNRCGEGWRGEREKKADF